jgi:hypothetical protein
MDNPQEMNRSIIVLVVSSETILLIVKYVNNKINLLVNI